MDMLDHNLDSSGDADVTCLVDSKDMLKDLTNVEEGSLGSGSEDQGTVGHLATQHLLDSGCGDDDVQYAFRGSDNATVTYRVVQVDDAIDPLSQIVTTGSFTGSPLPQVVTAPLNGHLYVLGNSGEVFTGSSQRSIAPRSMAHVDSVASVHCNNKKRDDRRRATHNEVERRRRDKINNWIMKLSKIIPDMSTDLTKGTTSFEGQSKGGILAKACEYIMELRQSNQRLSDCIKDGEQLSLDVETLRAQNEKLKRENTLLKQHLQQNGISIPTDICRS